MTLHQPVRPRAQKIRLVTRRFGARRHARLRSIPRHPHLRWTAPLSPAG